MLGQATPRRLHLVTPAHAGPPPDLGRAVAQGLTAHHKHLRDVFLYDREGARLADDVADAPDAWLAQAELETLRAHAEEVVELLPTTALLVEYGPLHLGRTRVLLDALFRHRYRLRFIPVEPGRDRLERVSRQLLEAYPHLEIDAVVADPDGGLLEVAQHEHPQLVAMLGGNLGRLSRTEAAAFLGGVHATMQYGDRMLVGVDLCRDGPTLENAHRDPHGLHAAWHKHLLERINRELGGHFELDAFGWRADYEEEEDRVAMGLVSLRDQTVRIDKLKLDVHFHADERLHVQYAYKYSRRELEILAHAAQFDLTRQWVDASRRYSLNLLTPLGR